MLEEGSDQGSDQESELQATREDALRRYREAVRNFVAWNKGLPNIPLEKWRVVVKTEHFQKRRDEMAGPWTRAQAECERLGISREELAKIESEEGV